MHLDHVHTARMQYRQIEDVPRRRYRAIPWCASQLRGDCWQSWPYPRWHVVSGRRTATRLHMREVRGDGVAYSAGPGEALANRRYGIKGGVSVGGSRTTGVGSVEERRPRPFPSSSSRLSRLGSAGSPVSEKPVCRKLSCREFGLSETGLPRRTLLGSPGNRANPLLSLTLPLFRNVRSLYQLVLHLL